MRKATNPTFTLKPIRVIERGGQVIYSKLADSDDTNSELQEGEGDVVIVLVSGFFVPYGVDWRAHLRGVLSAWTPPRVGDA